MKKFLILITTALLICSCTSVEKKQPILQSTEIVMQSERELNKSLREVPLKDKVYKNKLAYVNGEEIPFTGVFTNRYIGHLLYFEEYKNGLLHGSRAWFGDDGSIGLRKSYIDGVENGEQTTYYPNGNIRSIFPYINGKIEGIIEWYKEDGTMFDSSEILNGTGRYIIYWNNGEIHTEGYFTNNRKTGIWKEFNQKGELEKEITYSKRGTILKEKWYK